MFLTAAQPGSKEADEERDQMLDHFIGPEIEGDVRNSIIRQSCKASMDRGNYGRTHPMVTIAETAVQLTIDECLIMLESEEGNEQAIELLKQHFFI
jgi:hypothetical protein